MIMSGIDSKKPKRRKLKKTTVSKGPSPNPSGTPVDEPSNIESEVQHHYRKVSKPSKIHASLVRRMQNNTIYSFTFRRVPRSIVCSKQKVTELGIVQLIRC